VLAAGGLEGDCLQLGVGLGSGALAADGLEGDCLQLRNLDRSSLSQVALEGFTNGVGLGFGVLAADGLFGKLSVGSGVLAGGSDGVGLGFGVLAAGGLEGDCLQLRNLDRSSLSQVVLEDFTNDVGLGSGALAGGSGCLFLACENGRNLPLDQEPRLKDGMLHSKELHRNDNVVLFILSMLSFVFYKLSKVKYFFLFFFRANFLSKNN
jgi:hypothetical protein